MVAIAKSVDVAIIGAGSIGIAVAYYLSKAHGYRSIAIIDLRDPMSLTSAQSGENYRNWWPNPVMTAFTNHSIELLEEIARETDNRLNMSRRGYALVTRRQKPADLIDDLYRGYGEATDKLIRFHEGAGPHSGYLPPVSARWDTAPSGVDVLLDRNLIRQTFPTYQDNVETVLHVRRAGAISGQQLGQFMLERVSESGGTLIRGEVRAIDSGAAFAIHVTSAEESTVLKADRIVNAAGPYVQDVAQMLGVKLNVKCVYQQKIAFEDHQGVVPRQLPFTIDLDGQKLAWSDEERAILADDPLTRKLTEVMQGGIHCRPDGVEDGKWIKLGWAYNHSASDPHALDPNDPHFPDIVLRGASRLQPKLAAYLGHLPRGAHHYGGYYTMTDENWPLIGPIPDVPGAFVAGALSGFGTMAAAATGTVCADWVAGKPIAAYAHKLSPLRYQVAALMAEISAMTDRGHL